MCQEDFARDPRKNSQPGVLSWGGFLRSSPPSPSPGSDTNDIRPLKTIRIGVAWRMPLFFNPFLSRISFCCVWFQKVVIEYVLSCLSARRYRIVHRNCIYKFFSMSEIRILTRPPYQKITIFTAKRLSIQCNDGIPCACPSWANLKSKGSVRKSDLQRAALSCPWRLPVPAASRMKWRPCWAFPSVTFSVLQYFLWE